MIALENATLEQLQRVLKIVDIISGASLTVWLQWANSEWQFDNLYDFEDTVRGWEKELERMTA